LYEGRKGRKYFERKKRIAIQNGIR
jgi:hypothetical protein